MIYFDNAATSKQKPEEVFDAFNYYVREIGTSPGRGSYKLAIDASRKLYQCRKAVAEFFGINNASNVVFTKNSTEAINLFLHGFLKKGDHVIISPFEHNAVLRPLFFLKSKGLVDYTVLPEEAIYNCSFNLESVITHNTALAAITFSSNLTGQYVFTSDFAARLKALGIPVFVDASQGAGKHLINMISDNIDYLAFTGHKDLLAFPGVGGLVSQKALVIEPLIQGGTGVRGDSYMNPDVYPDAYEAGTINMPAIWSLKASLDYISEHYEQNNRLESELVSYAISELSKIDSITIYNRDKERVSTFSFNLANVPSNIVVEELSKKDICVRGGIHCAILAHETLGTVSTGAVRISLNFNNTKSEIDSLVYAIKELL